MFAENVGRAEHVNKDHAEFACHAMNGCGNEKCSRLFQTKEQHDAHHIMGSPLSKLALICEVRVASCEMLCLSKQFGVWFWDRNNSPGMFKCSLGISRSVILCL